MPFLRGKVKVREIGQMTVLEKDIVSDSQSSAQFCELPIVALAEAIKSDP